METTAINTPGRVPWNKGKFTGQKPPLKLNEIWAIRIRLQLSARTRDLAMFNPAIDSKLRACDLTKLRVRDICLGEHVISRPDHDPLAASIVVSEHSAMNVCRACPGTQRPDAPVVRAAD
jgi:hypothetical protein